MIDAVLSLSIEDFIMKILIVVLLAFVLGAIGGAFVLADPSSKYELYDGPSQEQMVGVVAPTDQQGDITTDDVPFGSDAIDVTYSQLRGAYLSNPIKANSLYGHKTVRLNPNWVAEIFLDEYDNGGVRIYPQFQLTASPDGLADFMEVKTYGKLEYSFICVVDGMRDDWIYLTACQFYQAPTPEVRNDNA